MIAEKKLRVAGDFPNRSVVEYATVFAEIKYSDIPDNLKVHDAGMRSDAHFLTKIGLTPTGRLTNDELHLDSVELAEAFKIYVEGLIQKRRYEATVYVEVRTSTKTQLTTKRREKHSCGVRALVGDKADK